MTSAKIRLGKVELTTWMAVVYGVFRRRAPSVFGGYTLRNDRQRRGIG